jgi:hypothetical protein
MRSTPASRRGTRRAASLVGGAVRLRRVIGIAMAACTAFAHADTFVVTSTSDAGSGSLRQAMLDANAKQSTDGSHCARHLITFAIPGAGPHTIQPLSALPKINIPITFDGYTQPGSSENTLTVGSNAVIAIELDGSLAGNADAFIVGAGIPGSPLCSGNTSWFRGFAINRFAGAAISMGEEACPVNEFCAVGGVLIQGNHFGTDPSGLVARGNGIALGRAALVFGTSSVVNVVGDQAASNGGPTDPRPQTRNVIAGNGADAILVSSTSSNPTNGFAQGHTIRNNYIGLAASGAAALPNAGRGVTLGFNSAGNAVHDNLVSANLGDGVAVLDNAFPGGGTTIIGNGIGIGVAGEPFGNGGHGALIAGVSTNVAIGSRWRLAPGAAAIANNSGAGVFVDGLAIVDAGNLSSARNGGLAFDLAPAGTNPNDIGDGDAGPNELLNRPVIESVTAGPGGVQGSITGSLDAVPASTYEIHFFYNDTCDAGGFGGGQTPYSLPGFVSVTTDAAGHADFTRNVDFLPIGKSLTAATRSFATTTQIPALITSEFSNCMPIGAGDPIFASGFEP